MIDPMPSRRKANTVYAGMAAATCLAFFLARHLYLRGQPEQLCVKPAGTLLALHNGRALLVTEAGNQIALTDTDLASGIGRVLSSDVNPGRAFEPGPVCGGWYAYA